MAHKCHIGGCEVSTKPTLLFCREHWAMVPNDMQSKVYEHYTPGQCSGGKIKREWIQAAMAARIHVEKLVREVPSDE